MLVIGNFSDTRRIKPLKKADAEPGDGKSKDPPNPHLVHIPAYHTGHLGFVPKKEVLLSGPLPQDDPRGPDKRTCEVVVTPHAISQDILKVSCTFHERKHVLERLVELLTFLNVNIVALESASVFEARYHAVHMVLDMRRSILSEKQMTDGERSKFIDILPNLRISNRRGLELFLYIIAQCHQILRWREGPGGLGRHIPQVFVSEFDEHEWTGDAERPKVFRGEVSYNTHEVTPNAEGGVATRHKARETYFQLPEASGRRIETLLGVTDKEQLDYLLLSDTDSRSLRIQFFQREHRKQIFELGFRHKNEIGALYTILRTVANSNFNVLSCLIRQIEPYVNVWEAVLEYQGPASDLDGRPADPRLAMKELLTESADKLKDQLAPYNVGIFIPSHLPSTPETRNIVRHWTECKPLVSGGHAGQPQRPRRPAPPRHGPVEQDWLIAYAKEMLFEGPKIFISCSSHEQALKYRVVLETRLEKRGWNASVYEELAKMDLTYAEAKRLVADADYLVGLWLPEERANGADRKGDAPPRTGPGTAKLSPWMHFEMGLAVALDREFKILASADLDTAGIVRRIAGDRPVFRFKKNIAAFSECVDSLLDFMELNWRKGRYYRKRRRSKPSSQSSPER